MKAKPKDEGETAKDDIALWLQCYDRVPRTATTSPNSLQDAIRDTDILFEAIRQRFGAGGTLIKTSA